MNNVIESLNENLFVLNSSIRLDQEEDTDNMEATFNKFDLIVIDPLYCCHRKNEDSASDMAPLLANIRRIALLNNQLILIIHHQGKNHE